MLLLIKHQDQPGQVAGVCGELAKENINVSYMTISRVLRGDRAVMVIGIDDAPSDEVRTREDKSWNAGVGAA